MSLFTISRSETGGSLYLASSTAVYRELASLRPDLAHALCSEWTMVRCGLPTCINIIGIAVASSLCRIADQTLTSVFSKPVPRQGLRYPPYRLSQPFPRRRPNQFLPRPYHRNAICFTTAVTASSHLHSASRARRLACPRDETCRRDPIATRRYGLLQ